MPNFKIEDFFIYKSLSPSSLVQNNLITFSYRSPDGVHDKKPLVLVLEKRLDRFFGVNIHYDMKELQEMVKNMEISIGQFLEKEYYKKYPENKRKLQEQRQKFNKSLITEQEYKQWINKYPKKDLEQFIVKRPDTENALRTYLYQRMTTVTKLVWKT